MTDRMGFRGCVNRGVFSSGASISAAIITAAVFLLPVMDACPQPMAEDGQLRLLLIDFYDGLAEVIYENIEDPKRCVAEADAYYKDKSELIGKVRQLSKEYTDELAGWLSLYESVGGSWTDIDYAIEKELLDKRGFSVKQPYMTYESSEYAIALEKFTFLYPEYGLAIARMAMEFLPAENGYGSEIIGGGGRE